MAEERVNVERRTIKTEQKVRLSSYCCLTKVILVKRIKNS